MIRQIREMLNQRRNMAVLSAVVRLDCNFLYWQLAPILLMTISAGEHVHGIARNILQASVRPGEVEFRYLNTELLGLVVQDGSCEVRSLIVNESSHLVCGVHNCQQCPLALLGRSP